MRSPLLWVTRRRETFQKRRAERATEFRETSAVRHIICPGVTEGKPAALYIRRGDDTFVPTPATVGPWDPALQHGGPPAALLGRVIETLGGRTDVRVSYFSLDFFGALPLAPMTVRAEIARPGKRIELATATAMIDGRPALRATAWRLAFGTGRGPRVGLDEAPPPMPDHESHESCEGVPTFGYRDAIEWRFVSGGFRVRGPAMVWSRLRIPLVLGEAPSPLARLLTMVDSANGVSWEADFLTYLFVPVNLSVSITRSPEGEWVGMHAITALAGDFSTPGVTWARRSRRYSSLDASYSYSTQRRSSESELTSSALPLARERSTPFPQSGLRILSSGKRLKSRSADINSSTPCRVAKATTRAS